MPQRDLLKLIAKRLGKAGLKYMVTGAWSAIFYGRIRTSHDLDFVVELDQAGVPNMRRFLSRLGNDFLFQRDVLREAVERRQMFNVVYLPTMDKIDFWVLGESPFDRERFGRRTQVDVWGQAIYVASPEDTILQKLRWYDRSRLEKHLIDAAFVYQVQEKLDYKYLRMWALKLGVGKHYEKLGGIKLEEHY